jgi:hypothetical protein
MPMKGLPLAACFTCGGFALSRPQLRLVWLLPAWLLYLQALLLAGVVAAGVAVVCFIFWQP